MKKWIISLILVMSMFLMNPITGIGISEDLDISIGNINIGDNISLENDSGFHIKERETNRNIITIEDKKIVVRILDREILEIRDTSNKEVRTMKIEEVLFESVDNEPILIKSNRYRGKILFLFKNNGRIINRLSIEEYLYGVLPREMGASFPTEALKAQAVASRSFALSNMSKHSKEGFHLCNTTHCQVYGGIDGENKKINEIVDLTCGITINYNGKVAEGIFHSNNGGFIESSESAWGGQRDYLMAREDPYSTNSPNSNWTVEYSRNEISSKLNSAGINIGQLIDINIIEKSDGKRVKNLEIIGSNKSENITGARFRTILGGTNLKSTYFNIVKDNNSQMNNEKTEKIYMINKDETIEKNSNRVFIANSLKVIESEKINGLNAIGKDRNKILNEYLETMNMTNEFTIKGHGYGHGVGMSQYGSKVMAEEGFDFEDILKYYYPGVQIY